MSRRRPAAADDLEIEFEGFERGSDVESAEVSFGRGPLGHGATPAGRRWPYAIAAVAAVMVGVRFLATRDHHAPTVTAAKESTPTTAVPASDRTTVAPSK